MARAEHVTICEAEARACFDAMADLERYPSWQAAVKAVNVRGRDDLGRPELVEFVTDAKLREVRYTLRYHYDPPRRIWWDYVEGDAKTVSGELTFTPQGDGRTSVRYVLDVDAGGRLVPGALKQSLADQAVESTLRKLCERVGSG